MFSATCLARFEAQAVLVRSARRITEREAKSSQQNGLHCDDGCNDGGPEVLTARASPHRQLTAHSPGWMAREGKARQGKARQGKARQAKSFKPKAKGQAKPSQEPGQEPSQAKSHEQRRQQLANTQPSLSQLTESQERATSSSSQARKHEKLHAVM